MRKLAHIILAIAGAAILATVTRDARPQASQASSHREAPLISEDPPADNTRTPSPSSPAGSQVRTRPRGRTTTVLAEFSRPGVLGGDLQGWPNGRRLGDDVPAQLGQPLGTIKSRMFSGLQRLRVLLVESGYEST